MSIHQFFRRARADNSGVGGGIWPKFQLIQALVLISLFVFKILNKNSILTSIKGSNSVANLPKFELIQAFMHVLVTCKNEVDQIKNEGARVFTRFLPLLVYGDFSRRSRAANSPVLGPIWPNFELVRDVRDVLITCKYVEDPIKNSDVQGQITLVLVVVSGQNLNTSKLSCMSSLPARMRVIDSKMKELECSQDFSYFKSRGFFQTLKGSKLRSPWSDLSKFRSRPRCNGCFRYLQV